MDIFELMHMLNSMHISMEDYKIIISNYKKAINYLAITHLSLLVLAIWQN